MMQLHTPEQASQWLRRCGTGMLHTDSRKVRSGDGFIAWPGAASDGRHYVQNALDAGAVGCLVEAQGAEVFDFHDDRVASFQGLKAGIGLVAAEYFGHPSQFLDVIAITGTNGKTSTAWWIAQVLNKLNYKSGKNCNSEHSSNFVEIYSAELVGTLGIGVPGKMEFNGLTTPDPVLLQSEFLRMKVQGVQACAIEASSIGLAEHRLAGTAIRVAVFTNFTQDHLDYHNDTQAYWQAKRALFDWSKLNSAVVNLDDPMGAELAAYCAARDVPVWSFSLLRTDATIWAKNVQYTDLGMYFTVCEGGQKIPIECAVVGEYNVSNLLAVIAALRTLGLSLEVVCAAISSCTAVPGRMEMVTQLGMPQVVVDYAHTPDALEKALAALRPVAKARGGKLWCVFGCGGSRDASKRPLMAAAAEQGANKVIVTSDNPRLEAPEVIIEQMMAGFNSPLEVHKQTHRAFAITDAVMQAGDRDVILIAGKGHEDYQDILGVKHIFSDAVQARAALLQRSERSQT
jgi:UDP-N-acetylmuramyl-tripeptide synthetase